MKKTLLIAISLTTLAGLGAFMANTDEKQSNPVFNQVALVETVQVEEKTQELAPEAQISPVPKTAMEEKPVVSQPTEQRLTDEQIIELFKAKAVFETPTNGYGNLVTIYSQPNSGWIRVCLSKTFEQYSGRFLPSTIDETILKLAPAMETPERAMEFAQLCNNPQNYL